MTGSHTSPPSALDCPLEVGPEDWAKREFYQLMTALVIPRPIGWISTISTDGTRNLAPYSYFNLMGSDPFYVAFGSDTDKNTVSNLRVVPEFVANIVSMNLFGEDEFHVNRFPAGRGRIFMGGIDPGSSGEGKAATSRRGKGPSRMPSDADLRRREYAHSLGPDRARPCRSIGMARWARRSEAA